ncbi:hypothetical protein L3V82_10315 [Thiotrichales bacterium 19S3-7]|nr:hypothetical protein [Thiotrichales bacterium 19S3-7]MCF6802550.1 hypothetical protein [Thiotrichales bacterium 19S3-11]
MTNEEEELAYWQEKVEKARIALSKRLDNAHIDNYEQNGTKMAYTSIPELRANLSHCKDQLKQCQIKVDGKNTSILGKGVFIR